MLHADGIRKGQEQIQFSLAVLEGARLQPKPVVINQRAARMAERALRPYEIHISGSQVLFWLVTAVASIGLFIWAIIRLWLFGA